jgi:hypothetical protein
MKSKMAEKIIWGCSSTNLSHADSASDRAEQGNALVFTVKLSRCKPSSRTDGQTPLFDISLLPDGLTANQGESLGNLHMKVRGTW